MAMIVAEEGSVNFESADFATLRRSKRNPIIIEFVLRTSVASLSLSTLISAIVSINKLKSADKTVFTQVQPLISANGWIIFLALFVLLCQIFAIVQLFVYIKVLYIKVPIGPFFWFLFPLINIVVNIICVVGYLSASIVLTLYTYSEIIAPAISDHDNSDLSDVIEYLLPLVVTQLFVFFSLVWFIVMTVVIILAKAVFKWPNYFISTE